MTTPLDEQTLARCVQTAALAPSLHNSQPWRFRIADGTVDVFADRNRQLEVLDPAGRELLISVGAAVFTLRLAVGAQGRIPLLTVLPDPELPDLVARIRTGRATTPSAQVNALAAAITARHTNRRPFADAVVPADSMEQLSVAAAQEGAVLTRASAVSRDTIIGLGQAAEARLRARGSYRAELGRWTQPRTHRRDGIPPTAYGPWDAMEHMPLRDRTGAPATVAPHRTVRGPPDHRGARHRRRRPAGLDPGRTSAATSPADRDLPAPGHHPDQPTRRNPRGA